jgi:TldD protein
LIKEHHLKDYLDRALNYAQTQGVQYADVRLVQNFTEILVVKGGLVDTINFSESIGIGVRALINGAWGFASSHDLSLPEIDRITALAISIARSSGSVRGDQVDLGPPVTSQGTYRTPVETDPFLIAPEEKLVELISADAEMSRVQGVRVRRSNLTFIKEDKWFANTDGAFTEQTIYEVGGGIQAIAVGGGEVQSRSYPSSFGRQQVTAGWEDRASGP